jgi:hypothetical protein
VAARLHFNGLPQSGEASWLSVGLGRARRESQIFLIRYKGNAVRGPRINRDFEVAQHIVYELAGQANGCASEPLIGPRIMLIVPVNGRGCDVDE